MSGKQVIEKKQGLFSRFLNFVEKKGNKLPHPITLFVIFSLVIILISAIAGGLGVSVEYEKMVDGVPEVVTVEAVSLITVDGIRKMFSNAVSNFTSFAPLGTVLVAMLGVGLAEGTGLISTSLRKVVLSAPKSLVTMAIVFTGVLSNVASTAGYVILVPLGALIFLSLGRHPIAGLTAAFAGVSGGYSANLVIGTLDPLLSGISQQTAQMLQPGYTVTPTSNWYFMMFSTFLITLLGTYVTEKIIEPRLGQYESDTESTIEDLTVLERKGLIWAGLSLLAYIIVILLLVVPSNGVLRSPDGDIIKNSAFMSGIVPIISLAFLIPGVAYGIATNVIKNDKDVASLFAKSMASMGSYIALAFFASQFINYFSWSNLGSILAVKGANFLKATGLTGIPLIVAFILISGFINLFISSGSAKWVIMAPVFVPMFMAVGYTPEFTQVAYRIGDSITNIITPLMSYFAVIIAFGQKYDKDIGIGTMISSMVPYSLVFLLGWTAQLIIWYVFNLPLGPGAFIKLM